MGDGNFNFNIQTTQAFVYNVVDYTLISGSKMPRNVAKVFRAKDNENSSSDMLKWSASFVNQIYTKKICKSCLLMWENGSGN